MDADIKKLYKQLYCKYPLKLTSSFEKGFKTVVCLSKEKADDYVRISVHTKDLKVSQKQ